MWDWLNNGRWGKGNRDHQSWNAWLHVRLTSTLVDVVTTKKNVPSTRKLVVTLTGVAACNFQLYVRTRWLEARSARPIRFYLATTSPGQICMYKPPPPQCCLLLYTWMHWRGTLPYGCHHRLLIWRAAALQSSWKQVEARHVSRVTITEAHR